MATSTSTQPQVKDGSKNRDGIPTLSVLVGIVLFSLWSCNDKTRSSSGISIRWHDGIATGLIIPFELLGDISEDSIDALLKIYVADREVQSSVLGAYKVSANFVVFEPLIPFTRGLQYELHLRDEMIQTIRIPSADPSSGPRVLSVYPQIDTVPENLLKMYIHFSKPMNESNPLRYVQLLRGEDTLREVFLDLRPALWNREGTMLTLWLDPGRIKRDLQPNKKLGTPLEEGNGYQLVIQPDWPGKNGARLKYGFEKFFVAGARDVTSPEPDQWHVQTPAGGTRDSLKIVLNEMLDLVLMQESIDVVDSEGVRVEGNIRISDEESVIIFIPHHPWSSGDYFLLCEGRLEDLAGNNLNRLFEEDLAVKGTKSTQEFYKVPFNIE